MSGHRRVCGFTLIEMLVVMAVVALLMTIALPRYFGSLERSKDTALQNNLKILRVTLDKFYADKGYFPESLDELVEHRYLRDVPIDPVTESRETWTAVPSPDVNIRGMADVKSGATGNASDGTPYEAY